MKLHDDGCQLKGNVSDVEETFAKTTKWNVYCGLKIGTMQHSSRLVVQCLKEIPACN